jgi:cobalt-precorrin 5A hydrolase
MGEAVIVAGIGCRSGVSVAEIDAALRAALAQVVPRPAAPNQYAHELPILTRIATAAAKGHEPAVAAVAQRHGVPLVLIAQPDLESANARTRTRSERSLKALNVHSVAEAAALAGAGEHSRLLGPRIKVGPVTCALATASRDVPQQSPVPQSEGLPPR